MTEMAPAEDETETELRLSLGPPSNNKPSSGSSSEQQQLEKAVSDPTSDKHYGGLSLGMLSSSSFPFAKQQQQEGSGGCGGGLSVMGSTSSRQMQTLAPKSGFVPSKRTYSDALVPAARQQPVAAVFPEQTDLNCRGSVSVNNGRNPHHHHPQLLHQALRWFPADSTKKHGVNTPRLPNPKVPQHQKQTINDKAQPSNSSNEACRTSDNPRPVVGWPPVRSFRRNSLVANNNSKPKSGEEAEVPSPDSSVDVECSSMYVKANMDGVPIGRKLDLKLYNGYASLKQALGEMFQRSIDEYVLTHEDKDGDWMLVGDVPWDMFLSTVRRLRLMKSSELGAAPLVSMGEDRRPRPRAC